MDDDAESSGFNGNNMMMFSSGAHEDFTKTPANAPANFTASSTKKRKSGPGDNTIPETSSTKKKPKTTTSKPASIPVAQSPASKGNKTTADQAFGPPQKEKAKRTITKKAAPARQIPRSLDECNEEDQQLINMRDSGTDWKAIRAKWEELTGEVTGVSTLPNRYARLKSNFTVIREEDQARLLEAKREVEESFENQKWDLVARVVKEKGGDNYSGVVLQRGYKKMMLSGQGVGPPPGVRDADFDVEMIDEDE